MLCDYGSGLGDYQTYLEKVYSNLHYTGVDVSNEIIERACEIHSNGDYICSSIIDATYDYIVSSGVFNVRQKASNDEWLDYILSTLMMFAEHSTKGFALNCLTKYSDIDRMKNNLYYADPLFLFDYCKIHFSRNVALLHDYDIYDFTIIVRRGDTWD